MSGANQASGPVGRRTLIGALACAYLAIVIGRAYTTEPYIDESWYAMPAWNLAANGSIGTPVIEPSGSPMPGMNVSLDGIRAHTYWMMPLPLVVQGAWYKVAGFSLVTVRLFTAFWGAVVLVAWYFLLKGLSGSRDLALLGAVLIACDYVFLTRAAFGRVDMMSAALGFVGIALYLDLRERSLGRALFAGHAGVALAGLTHPNGGIVSFLGLTVLILVFDRKRLRWRHAALVSIPYAAGAIGMGIYIMQDPASFSAQFFHNSTGRLSGLSAPLLIVPREIERYLEVYGLNAEGSAISRLKLAVLAVYAASAVWLASRRKLRRDFLPVLLLAGAYLVALATLENYKVQWYVLYIAPIFAAMTAIAAWSLERGERRWMVRAALAAVAVLQVGGVVRLIARNPYGKNYLPVIRFLKAGAGPDETIAASSQFGFGYGFRDNLDDDIRMGYRSGRHPDVIVVDERFREAMAYFQSGEPDVYRYEKDYLENRCVRVPVESSSAVYVRREAAARLGIRP